MLLFLPWVSGGGWLVLALGVSVLVPVIMLGSWMEGGSLGFRDPLLGDLLALFAVASALSVVLYRLIWLSARCAMRAWSKLLLLELSSSPCGLVCSAELVQGWVSPVSS